MVAEPLKQSLFPRVDASSKRLQEHIFQPLFSLVATEKKITGRQRRSYRGHWTQRLFSKPTANSWANEEFLKIVLMNDPGLRSPRLSCLESQGNKSSA